MVAQKTALLADLISFKRGDEVWLHGEYPCVVTADTRISVDTDEQVLVPITNILAFGDEREEEIYKDYEDYRNIKLFKTPEYD